MGNNRDTETIAHAQLQETGEGGRPRIKEEASPTNGEVTQGVGYSPASNQTLPSNFQKPDIAVMPGDGVPSVPNKTPSTSFDTGADILGDAGAAETWGRALREAIL